MRVGNPFGDRQSEACAARFARSRLVGTIEPVEDERLIPLGYADAGILNLDDHVLDRPLELDANAAAAWRVLDRVVDQDQEKPLKRAGVPGDRNRPVRDDPLEVKLLRLRQGLTSAAGLGHQSGYVGAR